MLSQEAQTAIQTEKKRRATRAAAGPLHTMPLSTDPRQQETADAASLCGECQKNLASLFCFHCKLDFCLTCTGALHTKPFTRLHKRVPLARKEQLLQHLSDSNSAASKDMQRIEAQMRKHKMRAQASLLESGVDHKTTQQGIHRWSVFQAAPSKLSPSGSGSNLVHETATDFKPIDYLASAASQHSSVFISFCFMSEADKTFAYRLVDALIAKNYTVWSDWMHIPSSSGSGPEWQKRLYTGIEESDIFLSVLSPEAAKFKICTIELEHALRCCKRIIPVLFQDTEYSLVHPTVASMQWMFFQDESKFDDSIRLLSRTIQHDQPHCQLHTRLLTRAILWKRQQYDVVYLLRGEDEKRVRRWLFESVEGQQPQPNHLMVNFITKCINIPSDAFTPEFAATQKAIGARLTPSAAIVYDINSADDQKFARKLSEYFIRENRSIAVDWVQEEPSPAWLERVHETIDAHDAVIYILSPSSVTSEPTQWQLDYAFQQNKRILPVVVADVDYSNLRKELTDMTWVFMKSDFEAGTKVLERALDARAAHMVFHTQLHERSLAWHRNGRSASYLMDSDVFGKATDWILQCALGESPKPTHLMIEYYENSERKHTKSCLVM